MTKLKRLKTGFGAVRLVALLVFLAACQVASAGVGPRIVVVGDVHGAFDELVQILQRTELVDESLQWTGGDAVLVQTGDLLDRGSHVREVLDLLMRLEREAPESGGRVEVLLGNHEALHMVGIFRDVHPDAFAAFATDDSEQRRKAEWKTLKTFVLQSARRLRQKPPSVGFDVREQWMQEHPLGWFEYRDAFSASGTYGQWLRQRPAALRLGDLYFVHGGLNQEISDRSPAAITARVHGEIRRFEELQTWLAEEEIVLPGADLHVVASALRQIVELGPDAGTERYERAAQAGDPGEWYLVSPDGPLWYRGMVYGDEEKIADEVLSLFDLDGIAYMAVAHTPQIDGRIGTRFNNRLFLIDTGLHPGHFEKGQPSALVVEESTIRAVYLNDEQVLVQGSAPIVSEAQLHGTDAAPRSERPAYVWRDVQGDPSPYQTRDTIEWFLRHAEVEHTEVLTSGITKPFKLTMVDDKVRLHAVFRYVDRHVPKAHGVGLWAAGKRLYDRAIHELAAYRLDRLLGLGRVPPVVQRDVDGRRGTVQAWLEGVMREVDRREQGLEPPDRAFWARQLEVMRVFDALIGDYDRNQGNMLIDSDWRLWLIDHTRSFHMLPDVVNINEFERCERHLYRALVDLDEAKVRSRLAGLIGEAEINALLSRREVLIEHFSSLIDERGEMAVLFDLGSNEGASGVDDLPALLEIPARTPFESIDTAP